MHEDDFFEPTEAGRLSRENDLLRLEVQHLRATRSPQFPSATGATVASGGGEAENDLIWLLRRLDESPLGGVFRRRAGFASLLSKWLPDDR